MEGVKFTPQVDDEDRQSTSKPNKPIYLFGKDVTKIACFRNSFICGICCGFSGGLASFLATSKTLLSTHIAFASLWIGVFGYWIPCRIKYENDCLMANKLKLKTDISKIKLPENKV